MNLSRPTNAVFIIAVVLAILAILTGMAGIAIPVVSQYSFETLALAFILLALGNLLRGL